MSNEMKDWMAENENEQWAKKILDLDAASRVELSTLVLAMKTILPDGAAEYGFADEARNTLRIAMNGKDEIAAIVINDELASMDDLMVLTKYVDYAKDAPDGCIDRINFDLLGLITTGRQPEHSVYTVDKRDPETETWFYSFHSKTTPEIHSGSFYSPTDNDVRIGCRGAYGRMFEETIPAHTWIDIHDPLEIAAFERAYAGNGPIAEVPEQEKWFDLMR